MGRLFNFDDKSIFWTKFSSFFCFGVFIYLAGFFLSVEFSICLGSKLPFIVTDSLVFFWFCTSFFSSSELGIYLCIFIFERFPSNWEYVSTLSIEDLSRFFLGLLTDLYIYCYFSSFWFIFLTSSAFCFIISARATLLACFDLIFSRLPSQLWPFLFYYATYIGLTSFGECLYWLSCSLLSLLAEKFKLSDFLIFECCEGDCTLSFLAFEP
jgi:hypothetical protein